MLTDERLAEIDRWLGQKTYLAANATLEAARDLRAEVERLQQVNVELVMCMDEPQKVAARHIAEENELRAEVERLRRADTNVQASFESVYEQLRKNLVTLGLAEGVCIQLAYELDLPPRSKRRVNVRDRTRRLLNEWQQARDKACVAAPQPNGDSHGEENKET